MKGIASHGSLVFVISFFVLMNIKKFPLFRFIIFSFYESYPYMLFLSNVFS